MNKIKLLFVINHLTIGGAQKSLISALKVMDYSKYDVTLYLRKNRTDLLPYVDSRVNVIINDDKNHYYRKPYAVLLQLCVKIFNILGKSKKAIEYNKKLTEAISDYKMAYEKNTHFSDSKYDIAVAYNQGYTAIFVDKCVSAEKKYVFFHTSTDEFHSVHQDILSRFHKIIAEHSDQAVLISEWYPDYKHKICIVENFVDSAFILERSREDMPNKTENKTVLCSCGRFAKVKGFDLAVKSASELKKAGINFIWYFVGDGPERENIENLIKELSLQNEIILTGMKENPYPYIGTCDIYVQPSYEENTGITILEAHRLARPVVSTKTVGGTKLIDDKVNGILCDITPVGIAKGIETLVNDKLLYGAVVRYLQGIDYLQDEEKHAFEWAEVLER